MFILSAFFHIPFHRQRGAESKDSAPLAAFVELVSEHPVVGIHVVDGWIYFRVEDPINFHLGNHMTAPLARIRKDGTDFEFLDQALSVEGRFSQ